MSVVSMAVMSGATARATALVGPRAAGIWIRDDRRWRGWRQQRAFERDRKERCALARPTAEPAVAPDNGGKGGTGLAWICIPRPGLLCDHRDPPLQVNGKTLAGRREREPSLVLVVLEAR